MGVKSQWFRSAARFIDRGWVQWTWRDEHGNVCLLQAVIDAMGIKQDAATLPMPVLRAIDATLMKMGTYCVGEKKQARRQEILLNQDAERLSELIWRWNDEDGRTKAEVVEALRRTAERLEGEQLLHERRAWLRDLMSRAVRPSARYYAEDDDFVLAD